MTQNSDLSNNRESSSLITDVFSLTSATAFATLPNNLEKRGAFWGISLLDPKGEN